MMHINEARIKRQVAALNQRLESRFGLTIELTDADHLFEVKTHYDDKRIALLQRLGESSALHHPDYAKAVMISEASTIILREIAPKRLKRKSKPTR